MNNRIERKQFFGNRDLVSYVVPENVTEIGDWAFARCRGLRWVAIPMGLERIGKDAFAECKSLVAAYIYGGRSGTGEAFAIGAVSEKQRIEGKLMAIGLRYFPRVQEILRATREGSGMDVWDQACEHFLQRPDEEGFVPFLAGGEEDYADDGDSLREHCKKARLTKAVVVYCRLLADRLGAEWGFGLAESARRFYQEQLGAKDSDLEILPGQTEYFREAVEIYEAAGLLTQESIRTLLNRVPEDKIELRTLLMERNAGNFMDDLTL